MFIDILIKYLDQLQQSIINDMKDSNQKLLPTSYICQTPAPNKWFLLIKLSGVQEQTLFEFQINLPGPP